MEFVYKKIIGPIDPKQPNQSLKMLTFVLRFIGVWPPLATASWMARVIYGVYSIIFRIFFLHIYTLCEAVYFKDVSDIKEAADAMFMLLTMMSLMYKWEKFSSNRFRIQACVRKLNSDLYVPQNEDEDKMMRETMLFLLGIWIFYSIPSVLTVLAFAFAPLIAGKMIIPIAAVYPIDTKTLAGYLPVYLYQIIGISIGASANIATDTTGVALLLHIKVQIDRLGSMLSKIGNDKMIMKKIISFNADGILDDEARQVNKMMEETKGSKGEVQAELKKCIFFHKNLLEFAAEVQDIYKGPIFCQFILSSLVICMTLLIMSEAQEVAKLVPMVPYLMAMTVQILLFCYAGNEVIWASNNLIKRIYFSNFTTFDKSTKNNLLIMLQRTQKVLVVKAGGIFQVSLSLSIFLGVMKSSYSYFTLLKSMEKN